MGEAADQRAKKPILGYEDAAAVILGLTFGLVMLDRGAISFLSPFIVADLGLTNAQLGLAAAIIALTWALSGFFIGRASDTAGRRKPFLVAAVVVFSLCSAACGLAGGFVLLVALRLTMGVAEGPVPPLAMTLLLGASGDHRRGFNIGVFAFFTGLVGNMLAPILLIGLANSFGWRTAFFLAGAPGLVIAAAIALWVREVPAGAAAPAMIQVAAPARPRRLLFLLMIRNISLCAVIASLLLAFMALCLIFLPLYLVQVRHLSPIDMGLVMTAFGASSLAGGLMLPALSDWLGRRVVVAAFACSGVVLPVGCLYWSGGTAGLAAICAVGALAAALPHMAIGMIPGESVPARDRGAALGLVMCAAELSGGFAVPALAGVLADRAGLAAVLAVAGACAAAAALLSLWLQETAPRLTLRRAALQAAMETS